MKIIESQSAVLSNYEVYQHIVEQQAKNKRANRRVPGNLATLMTEVVTYLRQKPGPLQDQEKTGAFSPAAIQLLIEKLRQANLGSELAKGEVLAILNLRPTCAEQLAAIVDDMEERYTDEEQKKIVAVIAEVLGGNGGAAEGNEAGHDESAVPSIENGNGY
ncbi:RNA polymerase Rpb4-domain-containing protein [Lasiosphaeris hirsuta]|uniref:DNA-directed RNA polymerase III subunit RPC9 n=1 Tax=Lasiosphaeris hirsuta TaxID=260670 RepID=A0AA39ZX89_9PEZI|nr:RNA polymerase Rpb4-domain-containing protein [Lasiosphaeris hirsuta]